MRLDGQQTQKQSSAEKEVGNVWPRPWMNYDAIPRIATTLVLTAVRKRGCPRETRRKTTDKDEGESLKTRTEAEIVAEIIT